MTIEIRLIHGEIATIDEEDFDLISMYRWRLSSKNPKNQYVVTTSRRVKGKQRIIRLHRLIMGVNDPNVDVDHKDGNTFNNTRDNLRLANASQNTANKKPSGFSKYLGVSFHKKNRKWTASTRKYDKQYHLGCFEREEDAALAYNKKAAEIHGEFARLNVITNA